MRARTAPSLKARALALLAQREHSPQELQLKLLAAVRREATQRQRRHPAGVAGNAHNSGDLVDFEETPDAGGGACPQEDFAEALAQTLAQTQAELPALLQELQAAGHLSAERFVASRVHSRASRFGNRRIAQELKQHGLATNEEASQILRESESERALKVFLGRFARSGGLAQDAAGRAKQMRFLVARGFSADAIRAVFKGTAGPSPQD